VNPFLSKEMAQQHIGDLRREARARRVPEEFKELSEDDCLTVRPATHADADSVRLLAALEGVTMPRGDVLVAQVGDDVVAALPLDGSSAIADPFRPTAELVELLKLRARQLRRESEDRRQRGHGVLDRLGTVLRAA
jgi:hypothetical protein